ncbi:GNAT family N-acetyltransferase [Maricurvus nonylphenolicus]|uniref:GNAT family N-acetyltransferase n=1 Tax=Maricurvus nonylphenolicus TaxID=1008307 RepID=UPI0036F1B2D6
MSSEITVTLADYSCLQDAQALRQLMQEYANDPMGGGKPLADEVVEELPDKLQAFPGAYSVIAWDGDTPIGLINSFTGFSTFKAKPLVNIHDVIVAPTYRRRGLALEMLRVVEQEAIERGCCKLTLEVLTGNQGAQAVYQQFGFAGYELDPQAGQAVFWEKKLSSPE